MVEEATVLTPQDALVAIMLSISMSDANVRTAELVAIHQVVNHLPIFADYDVDRIQKMVNITADLLEVEDGLDALFGIVREALPEEFFETAYAFACDIAAADGALYQPELRLLEEIRHELNIDRLHAGAIERAARARHMRL